MKPEVLLLGHFPKPIGGVSIHLLRLSSILGDRAVSLSFTGIIGLNVQKVFSIAGLWRLLRGARVLHYHTDERDWKKAFLVACWCLLRRQNYVFTLHSFRVDSATPSWQQRCWKFALSHAKRVVCISSEMNSRLQALFPSIKHTVVVPSFLPFSQLEMNADMPERIKAFISRYSTNVVFNAYRSSLWNDEPLYGEDLLLELVRHCQHHHPSVGFTVVFATSDHDDRSLPMIQQLQDSKNVMLLNGFGEFFAPVLANADISLRLTRDDGGPSLTVKEAELLNIDCIASDAVPRGESPYLFCSGDVVSLVNVFDEVLQQRSGQGNKQDSQSLDQFVDASELVHRLYSVQ